MLSESKCLPSSLHNAMEGAKPAAAASNVPATTPDDWQEARYGGQLPPFFFSALLKGSRPTNYWVIGKYWFRSLDSAACREVMMNVGFLKFVTRHCETQSDRASLQMQLWGARHFRQILLVEQKDQWGLHAEKNVDHMTSKSSWWFSKTSHFCL